MKNRNLRNPFLAAKSAVKGSALMITAVVVMAMVTISAVFLNDVITHSKLVDNYEDNYRLRYAADSGLEQVKYQAAANSTWLANNSSTAGFPAFTNLMIDAVPVDVVVTNVGPLTGGGTLYKILSTAEITTGGNVINSYKVSMNIIANNPLYVPRDVCLAAGTLQATKGQDFAGSLWSNGDMNLNNGWNGSFYPGSNDQVSYFYNDVGSAGLIQNPPVAYFYGARTEYGAARSVPDVGTTLSQAYASASAQADPFWIHPYNPFYASALPLVSYVDEGDWVTVANYTSPQVQISFLGNQVAITVTSSAGTKAGVYSLPANKLIYVGNNPTVGDPYPPLIKTFIKGGDLNGQLAIVSKHHIHIQNSIRYTDDEGDRAYILTHNGTPTSTDTPVGVSWTAANGYDYIPNPAYNGASNLHIVNATAAMMANGDYYRELMIDGAAMQPYNLEVHATIITPRLSGGWLNWNGSNYSIQPNPVLGNMRFVGAITNPSGWDIELWQMKWTWYLSQEFIYDSALTTNQPAWSPPAPAGSNGPASSSYTFSGWRRE